MSTLSRTMDRTIPVRGDTVLEHISARILNHDNLARELNARL